MADLIQSSSGEKKTSHSHQNTPLQVYADTYKTSTNHHKAFKTIFGGPRILKKDIKKKKKKKDSLIPMSCNKQNT